MNRPKPQKASVMETWVAIDTVTNRIVGIGSQADAQNSANVHKKLSNNNTIIRKLRVGMIIYEG